MSDVLSILIENGWSEIGVQQSKEFRIFKGGSPVSNGTMKTGGRLKLEKRGTLNRATVGPKSVCFFEYDGKSCSNFRTFKSTDIDSIKLFIRA